MIYRPEIDGLRAFAVIPVILYHAGFNLFSGGFIGVDIFFVISGYLITSIILKELESSDFKLLNFYERRARRILPALFFVVLCCFPFAWLYLWGDYFTDFFKSIIYVATFTSNMFFWNEIDYFSLSAYLMPLLHTWSLAVEEQYYIIFPLFMMASWSLGKRKIILSLSFFFCVSLLLSHYGAYNFSSANFYFFPTRSWEILLGVFTAFYSKYSTMNQSFIFRETLSTTGFTMIIFSIFIFNASSPLPSLLSIIPTIGTVLLILFANPKTFAYKILSYNLFVKIGLISYSAYLWHHPIFSFHKFIFPFSNNFEIKFLLIFLTFFLANITFHFIETPFRNRKKLPQKSILKLSIVSIMSMIIFGLIGMKNINHNISFSQRFDKLEYIFDNKKLQRDSWNIIGQKVGVYYPNYGVSDNLIDNALWFDSSQVNKTNVLIVGNSHSKDFYNVLHFSATAKDKIQLARYGANISQIDASFFQSKNYIASDIVALVSLFNNDDLVSLDGIIQDILADNKKIILFSSIFQKFPREFVTEIDELIYPKLQSNDIQSASFEINDFYTKSYFNNDWIDEERSLFSINEINELKRISKKYDVTLLNRMDYVCLNSSCDLVSNQLGKLFYDNGHHTVLGAQFFAKRVDELDWIELYFKK